MQRFIPVYGGKRSLIKHYPKPISDKIIQPFAGGGNYAVEYHWKDVLLVDLDERVIAVWDYLIGASMRDILDIPIVMETADLPDRYGDEVKWLVGWWLAPANSVGPRPRAYGWGISNPGTIWCEARRDTLAYQVQFIDHWKTLHGDYSEIDNELATWVIDPPYQIKGKHYRQSSDNIDFDHLGAWCRERMGQVIVCENVGADWLPFEPLYESFGQHRKHGRSNKEAVWIKDLTDLSVFD